MVTCGRSLSRLLVWAMALVLVMGALSLTAGCGDKGKGGGDANGGGEVAMTVIGVDGTKTYTLDEIKDMKSTGGYAGIKSSTGRITPPALFKGVSLDDLLADVGGLPDDMAVGIAAKDGYEMTLSVAQLRAGEFITYDMVTGDENKIDGPLTVIIAYESEGQPIDPETEGPLRMVIVSSEKNQVTDGHWSVKWVNQVQVKAIEQEWTLPLKGALTEEIDRSTFESCAAQGCHGGTWTDAEGNKWTGVPLYLLCGRVDDNVAHEGPAYNRDLAQAGYQVRIKTADGSSIELASTVMYYKKGLLVAYKMNGQPLAEEYWPLRLVGEGIEATDMVGQISEIEALVPGQ